MSTKVAQGSSATTADIAKYVVAALLALAGVVGFYWFTDWPAGIRGALMLVALLAAAGVFAVTERGRSVIEFLSESRFEMRKVIWPTRQETLRTTGVIIVVVIIISLLLALIDLMLGGVVRKLLG
ncbi:MAG: preprotein translocase subunit SecE [Lysobacteraceae bacterium]